MSSRVDTTAAAKSLTSIGFDKLPMLIVDSCLVDCSKELSATADMVLAGDIKLPYETFAMPKKRFGPRPVTITSAAARVAYLSLVEHLGDDLGPKSREEGNFRRYKSFALESGSEYIARFDIASFYEYVDHDFLSQVVLSRTFNPNLVASLRNVLGSVSEGTRGIPQLLTASDHLADAYVGTLERRLIRDGYSVSRFVDDFTVACPDWETANVVIELAAEYARSLGMVLSSEKTTITKRETAIAAEQSEEQFFKEKFEAAKVEHEAAIFLWSDYEDPFEEPNETAENGDADEGAGVDDVAMRFAMWSLVGDWLNMVQTSEPEDLHRLEGHYRAYLQAALVWLQRHSDRLSDDAIHELVFRHPLLLAPACRYVLSRVDEFGIFEDPWPTIRKLVVMGRQSPWAKLWLLDLVAQTQIRTKVPADYPVVMTWVQQQLTDRHEVVRAQAAWAAASHVSLSESSLMTLYTHASSMSQPALAACMAKQGGMKKAVVDAITQDGPMIKKAFSWADK